MMDFPEDQVLVAGDTLNDLSLYDTGYKGVVVGAAEAALTRATSGRDHVYQAKSPGAGGILEDIRDRKRVVSGKSVSVREELGGCRRIKKKRKTQYMNKWQIIIK